MLESGLDTDAGRRVEGKHLVEEVECVGVRLMEETLEGHLVRIWEVADIFLSARRTNAGKCFLVGGAKVV